MIITSFRASNLKRLVAVAVDPTTGLVRLTGANGAGKSSVLDAIWWTLAGTSVITSNPVRDGEEKAEVTLTLGAPDGAMAYKVTRKITRGKTSQVVVENADGARFPSPQALLDRLVGALTFDPEAFSRLSPKGRLEQLRAMVRLDVDVDALDAANRADYDRRTAVNGQVKTLKGNVDLYAAGVNLDIDTDPIHVEGLLREIDDAAKVNGEIRRRMDQSNSYATAIDNNKNEMARIRDEARRLIEKAYEIEGANDGLRRLRDATLVNPDGAPDTLFGVEVDVADLTRKVQDATRENSVRDLQRQQREKHQTAFAAFTLAAEESDAITARMDARTAQKRDALARAAMPVDGLSIGETDVHYNGQPWDQVATGDQIDVAVEMAMAANPAVKIIFIRNGSLLDTSHRARVAAKAEAKGYQVWSEEVDETGNVGIYFEDGAVVAVDGVKAKAVVVCEECGNPFDERFHNPITGACL